jgi:hypothetical protein
MMQRTSFNHLIAATIAALTLTLASAPFAHAGERVRLVIDEMTATSTTEHGTWPFINDRDEVYFSVLGTTSRALVDIPRVSPAPPENYYGFKDGGTRRRITLWEGDLSNGQAGVLTVTIAEQDNAQLKSIKTAVKAAFEVAGAGLATFVGLPEVSAPLLSAAKKDALVAGKAFVDSLSKSGDQTIGQFVVTIRNDNDRVTAEWTKSSGTTVIATEASAARLSATHKGKYGLLVRAEHVPTERRVHLRTYNGHYVVAEGGGGRELNANRTWARTWETFTLVDLNGGNLISGDRVNLRTFDGQHYVVAEGGGGREVKADRTWARSWETFIIQKLKGSGQILFNEAVAFKAKNGNYVVAEGGGGREVNANRSHARTWETFTLLNAR